MKVNFDYEIFYQQKYGGISSYYSNLGKELLKQNVDVNFICPVHKCYNLKSIPKDKLYGKKILKDKKSIIHLYILEPLSQHYII